MDNALKIEPPYGAIWDALSTGNVVPFLGAGASLVDRPEEFTWDGDHPQCLPTGSELAGFLAGKTGFPIEADRLYEREDLAKVSSYYVDTVGRPNLRRQLRSLLNGPYHPGPIHRLLASVPTSQVIVVTNYDTLLEQAFREAGKPFDLVIFPSDCAEFANAVLWWRHGGAEPDFVAPNSLDIDLSQTTVIYKMHGSVVAGSQELDSFVITEDDYVDFLSRMSTAVPRLLMRHFRTRSFLFLGYGLRDWNLRVVLKNVSKHLVNRKRDEIRSWAIQRHPSRLEEILWSNRNVKIFDVDLDQFAGKLSPQGPK
jgi:hypothetical protein